MKFNSSKLFRLKPFREETKANTEENLEDKVAREIQYAQVKLNFR